MHIGKKAQKREKSAMSVSLYGNLVFVVIELLMAIFTGSQAVLLDAVYDGVEFCMLLPSLFLIPLLYRPSNEQHPFGYTQIESIFVVVKGITMVSVTFGLIFNNIHLMLHGGHIVSFHTIASFEFFACFLGIVVTIYLSIKNKTMASPMINMEMQGWKIDSFLSLGMAVAFLLPILLPFAWFKPVIPYLDQIITITLSVIMLPAPIRTIITAFRDLMLIPPEEDTIEEIKNLVEPIIRSYGYQKLYYDILRTGRKLWTVSISHLKRTSYHLLNSKPSSQSVLQLSLKNILIFILSFYRILLSPEQRKLHWSRKFLKNRCKKCRKEQGKCK